MHCVRSLIINYMTAAGGLTWVASAVIHQRFLGVAATALISSAAAAAAAAAAAGAVLNVVDVE